MTFNAVQTLSQIEQIVKIKGEDYVYESPYGADGDCKYLAPNGSPSCLVALVVKEFIPDFPNDGFIEERAPYELPELKKYYDEKAISLLTYAQGQQDYYERYGRVYENTLDAFQKGEITY
jgi:hypothetical protein